ncbi:MAG: Cof-type HAD-IIB family hydrolase [Propionibacteriales bacterium]|nr:Cof-type HAD-IIB family hydrolase [Propionibacteriales bacterium]
MSPPRVVASDLDGTLLRDDGSVSARTRAALRLAERAGATVIIVTGRPPRWMDLVVDELGVRGLAICANGALVYDVTTRRIVEQYALPGEVALQVARTLRMELPGVTFAIERRMQFGREPIFAERWPVPDGSPRAELDELLAEPVAKLLARHEEMEPDAFKRRAIEVVGESAVATFSSPDALVEIMAVGVTKASTLAAVCAERGVDADQVVAFGDMPNDVPMLTWAGTSYAVETAHPEALAAADQVCGSNETDGVAVVLEQLFDGRRTSRTW